MVLLSALAQENIPSPAAYMRVLRIVNLGSVTELVAVLIGASRLFIIERYGVNAKFSERVQFRRFRNSIVIRVLP